MNRTQSLILLVLAVIAGGLGLVVYQHNSAAWKGSGAKATGAKVMDGFALNDVARVVIKDKDSAVTLVKKNDAWVVQDRSDYPADFNRIRTLVQELWELKPVQDVRVGPSQLGTLHLLTPVKGTTDAGMLVELQANDGKQIGTLMIGKQQLKESDTDSPFARGFPTGRYVMPTAGTNASKVSLVSETLYEADPKPTTWLDKGFVHPDGVKTITLSGSTPELQWKLSRDSQTAVDWKLADAKPDEKIDVSKVSPFLTQISSPNFEDVLAPDAKPAGLDKPETLTVETFDGITYTLKIGDAQEANYPVTVSLSAALPKERVAGKDEKPEEKKKLDDAFTAKNKELTEKVAKEKGFEARVYLVPKSALDPMIKGRADLLEAKKADPSPSPSPTAAAPTPASATPAHTPISVTTAPLSLPAPSASPTASPRAPHAKKKSN